MTDQWRQLDTATREQWVRQIADLLASRFGPDSVGRRQYGDTFQGDPVDQLIEEMADGLFYAFVAKAQWQALAGIADPAAYVQAVDLLEKAHYEQSRAHTHRRICCECDTARLEWGDPGCERYKPMAQEALRLSEEAIAALRAAKGGAA